MFKHFHGRGPRGVGVGVGGELSCIVLRCVVEDFQEGGVFFASGVFGILRKLWGKKDVVDDEVKAVRGDFVYLSIIINKSDQLGQGESEPLCCDDMATKKRVSLPTGG